MMNTRIEKLRDQSLGCVPCVSLERARLLTEFVQAHEDGYSLPVLRALALKHWCQHKHIFIGEDELIVGQRGPSIKATPTYPEIACHQRADFDQLHERTLTHYTVQPQDLSFHCETILPYWEKRCLRSRAFARLSTPWKKSYEAGVFTEFMEQRAPGHTAADGKIFVRGLLDAKRDIAHRRQDLLGSTRSHTRQQRETLKAMDIAADAMLLLAKRYRNLAMRLAANATDDRRKAELQRIAAACDRVPAYAPSNFWEAIQAYWFYHLGVVSELNGWDAFSPGHLDQHLTPFYERDIRSGRLDRNEAKELLGCLWIQFNNHPAPPKVGVTAAESGTYNDFVNINLGGLTPTGSDAVSEVSYLILEVIDELPLLQPGSNIQVSTKTPDDFLLRTLHLIRKGYGFPSLFNCDGVCSLLSKQGKSFIDAREGGTSGCVEAGAFGKEAYILTGYLNLVKILELTLNNGIDPKSGKQIGLQTGAVQTFGSFEQLFQAWDKQLAYFVDLKVTGNQVFEKLYAESLPAPFLSLLIDDCIQNAMDYHAGGARYNTSYIQGVGIGSLTDSFSAIKHHVFEHKNVSLERLVSMLNADFRDAELDRCRLRNKTPHYGNDDERADTIMRACFDAFFASVHGRQNRRGGSYHINMLPTTCHVYFGQMTGATPDGRRAGTPLSEGISPVQGVDTNGPTALLVSASKMDHQRTGGTLLNMKVNPSLLEQPQDLQKFMQMIRAYFALGGHHIQFNVVDRKTLLAAQLDPEQYQSLMVRVAGYSDYFCSLSRALQDEIIARTEHDCSFKNAGSLVYEATTSISDRKL